MHCTISIKMFVQYIIVLAIALILGSHGSLGTRPVLKSSGVGSPNRTYTPFDDLGRLADAVLTVRSIMIASFYQLDSIQFSYILKNGSIYCPPTRGEGFTVPQTIQLAKDEYIAKIEGTTVYNESISQVFITINNPNEFKSRVYGPFGALVGERNFTFKGYIMGIHGKIGPSFSRQIVRNLGVYHLAPVTESKYLGLAIGKSFYENPDMRFPPVVKISKIFISHGDRVYSLRVEYQLLDGGTKLGKKNGGDYGDLTTISFGNGEELVGLKVGVIVGSMTSQLTFISRKKDGGTAVYGPFGKEADKQITVNGHILGFTGTTSEFILSLGVFYSV